MPTLAAAPTATAEHRTGPPDRVRAAAAVALLVTVVTVLLVAFAWPATRSAPRDVPLGVAGPPAAAQELERQLGAAQPGAFALRRYADEAAARAGIEQREVYGAVLVGPGGPAVLTASAAAPAVAQALTQLAPRLAAAGGGAVPVRDVVAAPVDDPRGAGLAAAALPLVLGGIAAAGLLTVLVARRRARVAGALGFAVLAGAALAAVLQFWLGALAGSWPANAAVLALGLAAVSTTLLGLGSVLGPPGLGLGAAVLVALGNPLLAAAGAPELLPAGWGTLGQLLPPGAEITLLRSTAFFDGAGGGAALTVLLGWLGAGLLLCALGRTRPTTPVAAPAH